MAVIFTQANRTEFSAAQLVEIDKLSGARLSEYLLFGTVADKDAVIAKWKKKAPAQLRARVCLDHIVWGDKPAITWAADADIAVTQKTSVEDLVAAGQRFETVFEGVLNGNTSVEQRLVALGG